MTSPAAYGRENDDRSANWRHGRRVAGDDWARKLYSGADVEGEEMLRKPEGDDTDI